MPSEKTPEQSSFDFTERAAAPPPPAAAAPAKKEDARVLSVSDLVRGVARTIEGRFGMVLVEGEVSNFSAPRSGHLYFTLKDEDAQLPAVMFRAEAQRLKFALRDGLMVRARGRCSIFEGQGKFQMYVDALAPAGQGAWQLAFEALKKKLAAEGLFDPARKRPLPRWPRRIGIVTSPTGAAVRDILRIAERRGRARFLISPCQVQGETAAFEIARALRLVERYVDVVVVARGGGSAEDLMAFNDEALARAIAACKVPVVSAVGHEVDFTIADFVADVRAPTPSAAAELVVPSFDELTHRLEEADKRLMRAGRRALAEARLTVDATLERAAHAARQLDGKRRRALEAETRRLFALHPRARLAGDRKALVELSERLRLRMHEALQKRRRLFGVAAGQLSAMSPLAVLERGYSLVRDAGGAVVRDAAGIVPGDHVDITLARGRLDCVVQSADGKREPEGE